MKEKLIENIKQSQLFSEECKEKFIELIKEKKLNEIPVLGLIYKIENLVYKKSYIGQSTYMRRPLSHFESALKGDNFANDLYRDIRELGQEKFKTTIIDIGEIEELSNLERIHISMNDSKYNTALGGNNRTRQRKTIDYVYEENTKIVVYNSIITEILFNIDQQDIKYSCMTKIGKAKLNKNLSKRLKGFSFKFMNIEEAKSFFKQVIVIKKEKVIEKILQGKEIKDQNYLEGKYDKSWEHNLPRKPGFNGELPLTSKPILHLHSKQRFNNAIYASRYYKIEVKDIVDCALNKTISLDSRLRLKGHRFMFAQE